MANDVRLDTLIAKFRDFTGWEASNRPTDADLLILINSAYKTLRETIIAAEPQRFMSSDNITITSGTQSYSLPADHKALLGAYVYDTSLTSNYFRMNKIEFSQRYEYTSTGKENAMYYVVGEDTIEIWPTPNWSGTVKVEYIPTADQYTTSDSTINMVDGWDKWIIHYVDIILLARDKEDTSASAALLQREEASILQSSTLDLGQPRSIVDIYPHGRYRNRWWFRGRY